MWRHTFHIRTHSMCCHSKSMNTTKCSARCTNSKYYTKLYQCTFTILLPFVTYWFIPTVVYHAHVDVWVILLWALLTCSIVLQNERSKVGRHFLGRVRRLGPAHRRFGRRSWRGIVCHKLNSKHIACDGNVMKLAIRWTTLNNCNTKSNTNYEVIC